MKTFEVGFGVKFDSNLPAHMRWVEWMSSSDFPQEIMRRWNQASHLKRLIQLGKSIVNEQIYSYEGYQGQGFIEESITARFDSAGQGDMNSIGGSTVFLDPNVSGAKGPVTGMDESKLSYAAFFDRTEFNSFIGGSGVDVTSPKKFRPFFDAWTIAFFEHEQKEYLRSFIAAVKFKLPKHEARD